MLDNAQALAPELVRLRRALHAHPELSFQEHRTAQLVIDTLHEIGGYTVRTGVGRTGVVADLGHPAGPTIAVRADMDALPIQEETSAPYASTVPGVMHACGHDAHTAMLLGVAHLLRDQFARGALPGRVRLLFQPSEEYADDENQSGAQRMLAEGALDGVDAVIALHINTLQPTGRVTANPGWTTAAVDTFDGLVLARGGHAAYPHEGGDPIWMLGPVLSALYGIVARQIDPMHPAVLTVGQVHGGTAPNVMPTAVRLNGTLRSFNEHARMRLRTEVERAFAVARALGGDYHLTQLEGYPAGWNNPRMAEWMGQVVIDLLGEQALTPPGAGMGGEDFAYMCQTVPGMMINLGAAMDDGLARPHHTPIFDIDERALPHGAAILAETAARFMRGQVRF